MASPRAAQLGRIPILAAVACLVAVTDAGDRQPARADPSPAWTFAVISDLHLPRDGHVPAALERAIAAVIASQPRFVVITGDFTDGEPFDPAWRAREAPQWWSAVHRALTPIRDAKIPVLPIAGNHDSYLPVYRADYAAAWHDLTGWAAPLAIAGAPHRPFQIALDAPPFSYSTDVDGVHLALAHVVDEALDPSVAVWLARDLAAAKHARLRIVFGHVPLSSVATVPRRAWVGSFGAILAAGHADLYVAGHEHLVWDDDVVLPGGSRIEQMVVASLHASWRFAPSAESRARARCGPADRGLCCTMPKDGTPFELRRLHDLWYEVPAHAFTLITIEDRRISARAIGIGDDGAVEPFRATCERH